MGFVLAVLGCLLVIEGLPYLFFPSKVRSWSAALQEARDAPMRAVGLISVLSGLLLLLAIIVL
ncbi:hypothetical protein PLCT1_01055 [Planctomycetaceae bacterium]|nr:hypothetical protein PLCT1_01055 [Planctomycetaceae bacterium]